MWSLPWCLVVQAIATRAAYYHEKSVTTIEPPDKLLTDSFFGYSIAFENNRVVASAPRADKDGQVFSCGLTMKKCTRMNITVDANRHESSYYHNHNFWLGATVKSDDKHLFAPVPYCVCAPRSTSTLSLSPHSSQSTFITAGSCYYKDLMSDSNFHQMSRISTSDRRIGYLHKENLTDSFGWSMDIDTQGALRVGSPAMAAEQSSSTRQDDSNEPKVDGLCVSISDQRDGRVMTYSSLSEPNPTLFRSPYPHGYNFGYSIASGVFIKTLTKHKPDIAIGTPSGTGNGIGRVLFYENDQKKSLGSVADPADTVGSMFGASLCAAHIDGVSSSLLVGAPAHFTGDSYHTGIVYVYRQKIKDMKYVKKIEGPNKNGAFFGYAIANVGDMDHDGKDEIVIAAPYEDDGAGAVYLYAGSSLLDRNTDVTWLQRFQPSKFNNFGLSLAANKYSGNGCEELAIGAPGNDKVAVYHCLTVITVTVETTHPDLKNRKDKSSFAFDLCLHAKYPSKPENIQAQFEVKVQITHPYATLTDAVAPDHFFEYNETLNKPGNPVGCTKINVTTPENGDYEQEIQFNITAKLVDDPKDSNEFNASKATISSHSQLSGYLTVRAAECKGDTCEPELSVKLKSNVKSPYLIGSTKTVGVDVSVSNADADTAYRPCVRVNISGDATIRRAPESCKFDGDRQRICQLQRPLKANRTWDVTSDQSIELDLTSLTSKSNKIQVTAEVLNRCEASLPGIATRATVTIELKTNFDGVNIKSKTDEGINGTIKLNSEDIKEGKIIHHTYTITNTGEINWIGTHAEFWLYTAPYIAYKHPVQIYSGDTARASCPLPEGATSNGGFYALNCELGDLLRKETITVVIPITTLPVLDTILEKSNATVKTFLRVAADPHEKDKEELTTLVLHKASVPIWIIIVASAVGILLVVLIAFALRECGFLRREKKKELEDLQKEVKRKSQMVIRQSMRLTDSARAELRNKRMTYRELLDAAALKEVEEAEEVRESFGQARSSEKNNIDQANGLDNNAKSPLNGSSSVSSLDFRAQLEKAVKRGSKANKSDETPLCNDKEI